MLACLWLYNLETTSKKHEKLPPKSGKANYGDSASEDKHSSESGRATQDTATIKKSASLSFMKSQFVKKG